MSYNSNWFDEEFVPSVYRYFLDKKQKNEDEGNEDAPIFISEKQFNVISKNCNMESDGTFTHEWDGLLLVVCDNISKKGTKYFTVNFRDNYMEKYYDIGSSILERLIAIRDSGSEKTKEYAQTYYNTVMELLHITELDMEFLDYNKFHAEVEHAKEVNTYYVSLLVSIKKFIE